MGDVDACGPPVGRCGVSGEYWTALCAAAETDTNTQDQPAVSADEARRASRQAMWDTWVAQRAAAAREVPDWGAA